MIYDTRVVEISPQAEQFLEEKMIVLFGPEAPPELKPFCYIIDKNELTDDIEPGNQLYIDDIPFSIIGVGEAVNKNLRDLAHITLNFKGEKAFNMAGTLYLENKELPNISIGSRLIIK